MKKLLGVGRVYLLLILLMLVNTFLAFVLSDGVSTLFFTSCAITTVIGIVSLFNYLGIKKQIRNISEVSVESASVDSLLLSELKIPVFISANDEVIWYNTEFEGLLEDAREYIGKKVSSFVDEGFFAQLSESGHGRLALNNREFSAFSVDTKQSSETMSVFYLFDETDKLLLEKKYDESRPVVAIIAIDNLDEIANSAKDSEVVAFRSSVQNEIEKWVAGTMGICRRLTSDRYIMVFEERFLKKLKDEKFRVLESVKKLKFGELFVTLSIGVGCGGADFSECEEFAMQALDIALGRGGDQVAVKSKDNDYVFFGAAANTVEKRTKVRARIIAAALKEMIQTADNVIIMGHRFADLDSFGAAFGLHSAIRAMDKETYIVMDTDTSMAMPLVNRIRNINVELNLIDGESVLSRISSGTLLIIVDVHRPMFLDSRVVYDACEKVVVIDHHLKSVDFIEKTVLFYNETAASSSCEMVCELLQYINPKSVGQIQAEALLSGIMLDTRNFVLHTGVSTFQASAFLRNRGADPITVKKLFSGSMPSYRQRANIVATAELYGNCAIAENRVTDGDSRIATAQAADELLGISGVQGSFVLFLNGDEINISARSLGSINVQLIMEALGGGGHRIMAACQLQTNDFDKARTMLKEAIDSYKSKQ